MKNQPKIIRDRKKSLNRLASDKSQHSHRQTKPRTSSSLPKKTDRTNNPQPTHIHGSYLFAWGQTPNSVSPLPFENAIKISKNVTKYAIGQKHFVYLNGNSQAFGVGQSTFGQLGYFSSDNTGSLQVPILEQFLIQSVFCTPFCTFFITNRDEVFGCGLNNRGQLGISTTQSIGMPVKIAALSRTVSNLRLSGNFLKKDEDKKFNKIYSVALGEKALKSNESKLMTQEFEKDTSQFCLLEENQFIVSVEGGPFHTLSLTNKGRVFYTGNIYKKSTIINDQFTTNFTELNLKKIGKVQKIKAGLTCIGLLNMQGSLFILGAISEGIICDQPFNAGIACTIDFVLNQNHISVINSLGQLYFLIPNKKSIRTVLVENQKGYGRFKQITGGFDECLFTNEKGAILTPNSDFTKQGYQNHNLVDTQMKYIFGIKSNGNFCLGVSEIPELHKDGLFRINKNSEQSLTNDKLKKLQELEKENLLLKQLMKKNYGEANPHKKYEDKSNKENQCTTTSKFQINSRKISQKARTFDYSMEIPFQELELGKQISEGGYGIIYKATWRKTTVAVKIFKIDQQSQNSVKDFISQCHAMQALRHPNIVMFLGACTKPPTFAIVLEYCDGGTLWSILQRSGELQWPQRRKFALDIAKGMNYLHERPTPILHRDLKSLNILLDSNKQIKLADFGWTKGLQNYMTGKIGTYQWMAPQVVSSHQYTEKADVFSFGIILWEIASRQAPYRNIPGVQVAQDVATKNLRPTIPKRTPEGFGNLMKRCWAKDPNERPSFKSIIDQLMKMQLPE